VLFHHWADGWFAERCIFDVKGSSMFFVCVFHISRRVPGLIQEHKMWTRNKPRRKKVLN